MSDTSTLDLRGEVCPYTYVRTKLAIETRVEGDELYIHLDHRPAYRSVPRALKEDGHEVLSVDISTDAARCTVHVRVRKQAPTEDF